MTRIISCSVPYFFNSYVIINNFTDGIPGEPPHSFWLYGEPNGYNVKLKRSDNCSVIERSNTENKLSGWKVENCESKNHFVCQRLKEGICFYVLSQELKCQRICNILNFVLYFFLT